MAFDHLLGRNKNLLKTFWQEIKIQNISQAAKNLNASLCHHIDNTSNYCKVQKSKSFKNFGHNILAGD
jgi:hypothetical protein